MALRVTLTTAARVWRENGPVDIAAELKIEHWHEASADVRTIWAESYTVPIGSAQQSRTFDAIQAGFHYALEDALRWLAQILAGRPVLREQTDGTRVLDVVPESSGLTDA